MTGETGEFPDTLELELEDGTAIEIYGDIVGAVHCTRPIGE